MLLDFVIGEPGVDVVRDRSRQGRASSRSDSACRCAICRSGPSRPLTSGLTPTTRYFVHKLPIGVAGDPPRLHFVTLALDPSGQGFAQFLHDHARLLSHLSDWTIVAVGPKGWSGATGCRALFDRYVAGHPVGVDGLGSPRGRPVLRHAPGRRSQRPRAPVGDRSEPLSRSTTTVRRPHRRNAVRAVARRRRSRARRAGTRRTRARVRQPRTPSSHASCRSRTSSLATWRACADGPPRHHHAGSPVGPCVGSVSARARRLARHRARRITRVVCVGWPSHRRGEPRATGGEVRRPGVAAESRTRRGSDPPVFAGP